jgi:hypothetical protein
MIYNDKKRRNLRYYLYTALPFFQAAQFDTQNTDFRNDSKVAIP